MRVPINSWLDHVEQGGVEIIPVSRAIAVRAVTLTEHHKDPADRIIIATAIVHQAKLLSIDQRFRHYQELGDLLLT